MNFYFFATIHHWSWCRFKKGKFIEDESYEWRDAVLDRRLGVRIRETKYFIFFREIRYKQREHNYWIEKAGGWRIKIPFCKTYEQTRIANWIVVDLPSMIFAFWIYRQFLYPLLKNWCNTRPTREKQGALLSLSFFRQNLTHFTPAAMAGFLLPVV